ncbi:hypothetical protein WDU94_013554 [Cyamophila willieti]
MVDRMDYRRHSLSRLLRDRDDKSYKDNFSRSYNSENIEKILSRTRSLISDFDSGKSYGTLPPRLRLTGSKYSSSSTSPGGGVTTRSYKSRSPSYTSSTSPSLSRRSFLPRSISPTPLTNGLGPSRHTLSPPRLSSPPRNRSSPSRKNSSSRISPTRNSTGILNELSVPKSGSSSNATDTVDSRVSSRRRSSSTLPTALSSSLSNSAKYEKCYNDLLTRINHIKMNGGDTLHEGRTSTSTTSNVPEFDRSKKPYQDRLSHYDRRDSSVAGTNVGPGLTGLKNLGNTCYINSILQCLSNTSPLRAYFESEFKKSMASYAGGAGGKLAEEFQFIFKMLWAGDSRYFSPVKFKDEVGKMKRTFRGYEQQDSHEFLTILIDSLHEDLKEPEHKNSLTGALVESGEKSWGEFLKKNKSIVSQLFYGQLKSTVMCLSCQETSSTFEVFSNVSLPLPANDRCTLKDCLDLYLQGEEIQGWHCPRCKTKRDARKKLDITILPPILVLHFKRFTSDGWCRKKQTTVEFPENNLSMSEYNINPESRDSRYDLYAVSNHYGTMESGHYTAYCRNKYKWYKFDDSDVSEISSSKLVSPAAYILFYISSRLEH